MSGPCRNTVSASWTTTGSASPTSASSHRACSVAAATTPKWACWSVASGPRISSSTAASKARLLYHVEMGRRKKRGCVDGTKDCWCTLCACFQGLCWWCEFQWNLIESCSAVVPKIVYQLSLVVLHIKIIWMEKKQSVWNAVSVQTLNHMNFGSRKWLPLQGFHGVLVLCRRFKTLNLRPWKV